MRTFPSRIKTYFILSGYSTGAKVQFYGTLRHNNVKTVMVDCLCQEFNEFLVMGAILQKNLMKTLGQNFDFVNI